MSIFTDIEYLVPLTLFFNILLAMTIIFLERKDATSTWAWILVLFFLPLAGFILYLLLGRQLRRKHLFRWEGRKDIGIDNLITYQMEAIRDETFEFRIANAENYQEMIYMHLRTNNAVLTQDNHLDIFDDGADKFEQLLKDIEAAKDHIHIQYYIFRLDDLGTRIVNALIKKAKQGVKVRLLYDEMGSRNVKRRHFKELLHAGGEVEVFFPSILPLLNPRLNFRNHRKIVVIDGRIGYIGGFNVGDEYLGLQKSLVIGVIHTYVLRVVPYILCKPAFYLTGTKLVLNKKWGTLIVTSLPSRKKVMWVYRLFQVDQTRTGSK